MQPHGLIGIFPKAKKSGLGNKGVETIVIVVMATRVATESWYPGYRGRQPEGIFPLPTHYLYTKSLYSEGNQSPSRRSLSGRFAFGVHTQIIVQLVGCGSRGVALVSQLCPDLSQRWQTSLQLESYNRNIYMTVSGHRAATSTISRLCACVTAYRTECEVTNTGCIQFSIW